MALQELALRMQNRPGQLARVARILAEARINLAAISVASSGRLGWVRMIVDRPEAALSLLTAEGFTVERQELIAVRLTDQSGSFLKVLDLLAAERINLQSVAILVAKEGSQSLVALSASNLPKARKALERAGLLSTSAERLVSNADLLAGAPTIPSESVGLLL